MNEFVSMKLQTKTIFASLIATLILTDQAISGGVQKSCLNYEPDSVILSGIANPKLFPGKPNYEDTSSGDEVDKQWVLKLTKKICVNGSGKDDTNMESEYDVALVQLVVTGKEQWSVLHKSKGSKIAVKGTLFHSFNAHHKTKVLITIMNINKISK
jgi:hypothetical protein